MANEFTGKIGPTHAYTSLLPPPHTHALHSLHAYFALSPLRTRAERTVFPDTRWKLCKEQGIH